MNLLPANRIVSMACPVLVLACWMVVDTSTTVTAQQPAGPKPAPAVAAPIGPPPGFELDPSQEKRLDQMLGYWEQRTSGIKTFRAKFQRWTYDPVFGPKTEASRISTGEVRYAAPDKGMIKETLVGEFDQEKAKAGEKFPFTKKEGHGEHWVCDGQSVFEFDHKNQKLIETKLPPDMQGQAIAEGPLPFMFGAKADTIRERYWIREIPRPHAEAPYYLEFIPKRAGEGFSKLIIQLHNKEFMPEVMTIHELNKVGRNVYQFTDRHKDGVADNVNNFFNSFVRPNVPRGWTKQVIDVAGAAPSGERR